MFNMEEGKEFSYCHKEMDNRPPDQHIYRSDYSLDNIVYKVTIDHLAPCNSDDYFNVCMYFLQSNIGTNKQKPTDIESTV